MPTIVLDQKPVADLNSTSFQDNFREQYLDEIKLDARNVNSETLITRDFVVGTNGSRVPGRFFLKGTPAECVVWVELNRKEVLEVEKRIDKERGNVNIVTWVQEEGWKVHFPEDNTGVWAVLKAENGTEIHLKPDGTAKAANVQFLEGYHLGTQLSDPGQE